MNLTVANLTMRYKNATAPPDMQKYTPQSVIAIENMYPIVNAVVRIVQPSLPNGKIQTHLDISFRHYISAVAKQAKQNATQ